MTTPKVARRGNFKEYLGALKSLTGADRAKVKKTGSGESVAEAVKLAQSIKKASSRPAQHCICSPPSACRTCGHGHVHRLNAQVSQVSRRSVPTKLGSKMVAGRSLSQRSVVAMASRRAFDIDGAWYRA